MFRITLTEQFVPRPDLPVKSAQTKVITRKTSTVLRLADIKPEDPPERLVEIIQNLAGNIPKEEREMAMNDLISRFQYLIKKFTNSIFYGYNLKARINYEYADLLQDALMEFCYLVTQDFKIKADLNDTGLAVFGSYIKVKLYRRLQYKTQERLRKSGDGNDKLVDIDDAFTGAQDNSAEGGFRDRSGYVGHEIRQAIIANALRYDDMVLDSMSDEECSKILQEIIDIANAVLEPRDRKVWELYYISHYMVGEIGAQVSSKVPGDENKPIGRQRVLQIARDANSLILQEFGRRAGLRRSGL